MISFYVIDGPRSTSQRYNSAALISIDRIRDIPWKEFSENNKVIYYITLDQQGKYIGLDDYLKEAWDYLYDSHANVIEPSQCERSSISNVLDSIINSKTICITFGAGLSSGYVPTLIEVANSLGLKKNTSDDSMTDKSMSEFFVKFYQKADYYLKKISWEWNKISGIQINSTPAHEALMSLIIFTKKLGKNVFVYTDNIDGIHKKVGISLSEQEDKDRYISTIIYPPQEVINRKTTVLVCGQSFDFHGILSTLNTRALRDNIVYYSFNISKNSIGIYEDLDVDELENSEKPFNSYQMSNLNMNVVEGSCHDTITKLLHACEQEIDFRMSVNKFGKESLLWGYKEKSEAELNNESRGLYDALVNKCMIRDPTALDRMLIMKLSALRPICRP